MAPDERVDLFEQILAADGSLLPEDETRRRVNQLYEGFDGTTEEAERLKNDLLLRWRQHRVVAQEDGVI